MLNYLATALWRGIYAGAVGFGAVLGFCALALLAASLGALVGWICQRVNGEAETDGDD